MGLGGISVWQLIIVLAIIILLFGTKKIGNLGIDLGKSVQGFKKAMNDNDRLMDDELINESIVDTEFNAEITNSLQEHS